MNKKIYRSLFLLIAVFIFFRGDVYAQELRRPLSYPSSKSNIYSNVSITDKKIISQNGNKINLSFTLFNENDIQSDIRYAVILSPADVNEIVIKDRMIYDKKITLGQGESSNEQIMYSAPEYLTGKYRLNLRVTNSEGLLFTQVNIGEIELDKSNSDFAEIVQESCLVYVNRNGEKMDYRLDYGVIVNSGDELFLTCKIKNSSNKNIEVVPSFAVYSRSVYGTKLVDSLGSAIKINAGETIGTDLKLPKETIPQGYDVEIFLLKDGSIFSNKVTAHYVVAGLSATVQNIKLDKDYYKSGDTAKASFLITGPADQSAFDRSGTSFEGGRVEIIIKNGEGEECSNLVSAEFKDIGEERADVSIKKECKNPSLLIKILDKNGNVLDEGRIGLVSKSNNVESGVSIGDKLINFKKFIFGVSLVLIIATIILIFLRVKKRGLNLFIFFLLLQFIFGIQISLASVCDNFDQWVGANWTPPGNYYVGTYNWDSPVDYRGRDILYMDFMCVLYPYQDWIIKTDKAVYAPGETITVSVLVPNGTVYHAPCGNASNVYYIDPMGLYNSSGAYVGGGNSSNIVDETGSWVIRTEIAPMTSGSYRLGMESHSISYGHHPNDIRYDTYRYDYFNFSVSSPFTNGSCGSAQGTYAATDTVWRAPYCNQGTPSPAAPAFPALGATTNWQCVGSGPGHIDAPCNATRNYATPNVDLSIVSPANINNINNNTLAPGTANITLNWNITNQAQACGGGCTCDLTDINSGSTTSNIPYPATSSNTKTIGPGTHDYSMVCRNSQNNTGNIDTASVTARCTPQTGPNVCNRPCGDGTYERQTIAADCTIGTINGGTCNLMNCPASTSFEEVRP